VLFIVLSVLNLGDTINKILATAGDYGLKYNGITRHALNKWDYIYRLRLANPDFFDSYYGQGNFSKIDPNLDGQNYYITTYNNYKLVGGLRRQFWNQSTFEITTGYDFYVNKTLENTILEFETELLGANERLSIIPAEFKFDLDFRDDNTFPRRGSKFFLYGYQGIITNKDWQQFGMIGGGIEQYFSTHNFRPFTLGFKIGGMKGLGEVPFYLQPRLGGNNLLRGYTSNRFFGRSTMYLNTELRWRAFKNDDASIPYEFGFSVFYDTGKVSNLSNDPLIENKWHYGYGGGIFFVPFDERFTLSLYLTFSEENRYYPQFTIGSAIN
jgi:hemolysin activation/secretion protein